MALAPDLGHVFDLAEIQAVGRADRYAGRFQALIDPIHAIVAFDGSAGFRIPLRCAPGAGRDAGLAPHAQVRIHKNDAVFGSFLHGPGGTGRHAPGILAVKAGHKNIGSPGQTAYKFGTDRNNLADAGTDRQILVALALNRTGVTADTLFGIL